MPAALAACAGGGVDREHLMPEGAQRPDDLRGTRDRDVALLAGSAE